MGVEQALAFQLGPAKGLLDGRQPLVGGREPVDLPG
jgi:hypothetical protein